MIRQGAYRRKNFVIYAITRPVDLRMSIALYCQGINNVHIRSAGRAAMSWLNNLTCGEV